MLSCSICYDIISYLQSRASEDYGIDKTCSRSRAWLRPPNTPKRSKDGKSIDWSMYRLVKGYHVQMFISPHPGGYVYAPQPPPRTNTLSSWEEKFIRERTSQPASAVFCPKVTQYADTDRKLYVIQKGGICGSGRLHPKRPIFLSIKDRQIMFHQCRDAQCM